MATTFGNYIKTLRLAREITLRSFAERIQMDPANYSRMERGKTDAPRDESKLGVIRNALGLSADSGEWREAVRLAALSRGELSPRILNNAELMAKLPALFRTLEGDGIDDDTLEELIHIIERD